MDVVIDRFVKLEGASNFREIGGLETVNGKIKSGILFRSDELSGLTVNDLKVIESLGIKVICDLRTPAERKAKPDKLPNDYPIKSVNVPFYHQKRDFNQLQIMWFLITNSKNINFEKFIKEHYLNNAFNRTKEIGEIFNLIADENNLPILFHCKAGKDRTGLITALIQLTAGVHLTKVMEDYLLTNELMKLKMEKAEKIIRRMSFFRIPSEKIKPLLEVRREYLEVVIDEIFNKYDSVENYLTKACGLDKQIIEKVKGIITTR